MSTPDTIRQLREALSLAKADVQAAHERADAAKLKLAEALTPFRPGDIVVYSGPHLKDRGRYRVFEISSDGGIGQVNTRPLTKPLIIQRFEHGCSASDPMHVRHWVLDADHLAKETTP